jgi:hypothetical protein
MDVYKTTPALLEVIWHGIRFSVPFRGDADASEGPSAFRLATLSEFDRNSDLGRLFDRIQMWE